MLLADQVGACPARPVPGFGDDVAEVAEPGRQAATVLSQAHALFNDACDGRAVEVRQALVVAAGGDELGIAVHVGVVALDLGVELGADLEQIAEVGIGVVEQVVDPWGADQRDLDVKRNGFGIETRRRRQSQFFRHGL